MGGSARAGAEPATEMGVVTRSAGFLSTAAASHALQRSARARAGARLEAAHVVIARAAADDEHALVAERCEGAADREMLLRIEVPLGAESCTVGRRASGNATLNGTKHAVVEASARSSAADSICAFGKSSRTRAASFGSPGAGHELVRARAKP